MKKKIAFFFLPVLLLGFITSFSQPAQRQYYEIKVYRVATNEQVKKVDAFLKDAYIPALHRAGIRQTGVFHLVTNDTATDKRVYVFIPLRSLDQVSSLEDLLVNDAELAKAGDAYWNAAFDATPYIRIESILLKAFPLMPRYNAPQLSGNKTERIYELRSYEGPTEKLYRKKVEMFNKGGEVALFNRLGFNAVFYGEVIAGSRMPNLMYMTSFNNRAEREAHWNTFKDDPEWKQLSALPEYQHTVSRNETLLLHPAEFSEL